MSNVNSQADVLQRISIGRPGACWPWVKGSILRNGYAMASYEGKRVLAHRLIYEWFRGPIPNGLYIDHVCRNKRCCNPNHLRTVTPFQSVTENCDTIISEQVKKTHCKRGHPLFGPNVRLRNNGRRRACRACDGRRPQWAQ